MPNFISRLVNCTVSGIKGVCPRLTRGTIGQRDSDDTAVLSCLHFKQVLQWVLQGDIYSTTHAYTLCQQTTGLSSGVFSLRCSEKKKGGGVGGRKGKTKETCCWLIRRSNKNVSMSALHCRAKTVTPQRKIPNENRPTWPKRLGCIYSILIFGFEKPFSPTGNA